MFIRVHTFYRNLYTHSIGPIRFLPFLYLQMITRWKLSNPAYFQGLDRSPALGNQLQVISSFWALSNKGIWILNGKRPQLAYGPPSHWLAKVGPLLWGSSKCIQVHPSSFLKARPRDFPRAALASLTINLCLKSDIRRHLWNTPVIQESYWYAFGVWFC